jgi:hypothetical protein
MSFIFCAPTSAIYERRSSQIQPARNISSQNWGWLPVGLKDDFPEWIIDHESLTRRFARPGGVWADFGSGRGHFLALAELVGAGGQIILSIRIVASP